MSRSSVEWWPESGAHTSTTGSSFSLRDGVAVVGEALEAQQPAERLFDDRLLDDRNVVAVLDDLMNVELGLLVILAEPVEQFVTGGEAAWRRARRRADWPDSTNDFDAAWAQAVRGHSMARWNS